MHFVRWAVIGTMVSSAMFAACAASDGVSSGTTPGAGAGGGGGVGAGGAGASASGGGLSWDGGSSDSGVSCVPCSDDGTQVLNCDGSVAKTCPDGQLCGGGQCMAPCEAAKANKSTVGCDYFAVTLNAMSGGFGGCFVAFVANTSKQAVKVQASFGGTSIDLAKHAALPQGTGTQIKYQPYDPSVGLPPGEVAILFLANDPVQHGTWSAPAACPVPAAVGLDAHVHYGMNISTGRSKAFHITTDGPVVAYQMLPFNAAHAATTGATLLLPTSAWDKNYVAVAAWGTAYYQGMPIPPSTAIVAAEDDTTVTILPNTEIKAGMNVPAMPKGKTTKLMLQKGETIEIIETNEITGSPIESDKPIGVFAGHLGLRIPNDGDWSDHAEQQIPPVRALGNEYAVASYRDRVPGFAEKRRHRVIGTVADTHVTFDPPSVSPPATLSLGTVLEIESDVPFVVKSQDLDHPFMVFSYMSGSSTIANAGGPQGYGDPDFVSIVPGPQYMKRYVFFTDPTYPETNLVVVRRKGKSGFADVTLDCAGKLTGFQPIGSTGEYEYTRVDLSRHKFEPQGQCNNGRREMSSAESFGLWVWGWGSPETRAGKDNPCDLSQPDNTCDVSYAYPAGEKVTPINTVYVPSTPK